MTIIFLLGIGNFALHRAVLESGHPVLAQMPDLLQRWNGKVALAVEFLVLLCALMAAAHGWPGLVWFYLGYSAVNAGAAWLILTGRV